MTTAAVYVNQSKEHAVEAARLLPRIAIELGLRLVSPQDSLVKWLDLEPEAAADPPDFCLVVGGDGTILSAAKHYAPLSIPLLGVNAGHLGFLTEVELKQLRSALHQVMAGCYHLDERAMLQVGIKRQGQELGSFLALNDLVVTRGTFARIITVDVLISGNYAERYRADGVIVATPTGSTAYSLAAGGPVVHPETKIFIINPICPHSLRDRSMVVQDTEIVQLRVVHAGGEVMLTVDGQVGYPLQSGDCVEAVRSQLVTKLIRLSTSGFYDAFRTRISGKCEEDESEG